MSKEIAIIFVHAMIEAGSDIKAIGRNHYVVIDPVDLENETAQNRINELEQIL